MVKPHTVYTLGLDSDNQFHIILITEYFSVPFFFFFAQSNVQTIQVIG